MPKYNKFNQTEQIAGEIQTKVQLCRHKNGSHRFANKINLMKNYKIVGKMENSIYTYISAISAISAALHEQICVPGNGKKWLQMDLT